MTEDELKALKDLPAPPPRAGAKAAALDAAMAAFDANANKNPEASQGNDSAARPIHASNANRRQKMRAPMFYKIAAGIAIAVVATPAAIYLINTESYYAPKPDTTTPKLVSKDDRKEKTEGRDQLARTDRDGPLSGESDNEAILADDKVGYDRLLEQPSGAPKPTASAQPNTDPAPSGGLTSTATGLAASETGPETIGNALQAPPAESKALPASGQQQFASTPAAGDQPVQPEAEEHRDRFEATDPNPVKQVAAEPVSTFSIDVDTASYAFMRRSLNAGYLPPKDAVRIEEMINYFPYAYPRPETAETPFQPTVTVVPSPWKPTNKLIHIGIKGYDLTAAERPRANLVFLIDISGSMASSDKLPLMQNAFRMLVDELQPEDTVAIVTYASGSGVLLEPTKIADKSKILAAIETLGAGGSTAGAQGIADAYRLAEAHYDKEGVNRIILATDGDFNVGISNPDELQGFIERKREAGIFLSILGVGEGNYNDALMQTLAQNGNGTAAYVDTLNEARKVLVDEASSTLFTIAKDVKIQIEFNPAQVSEYRLIGYETRALAREDFNNDKVDAGDIGSGHTVTAIYEITPVDAPKLVDDLRYQKPGEPTVVAPDQNGELAFLKLRYKLPEEDTSKLITIPVTSDMQKADISQSPEDVRFSIAVAAFGQSLRGLPYLQDYSYDEILALAQTARGNDPYGYRAEFLNLVRLAKSAKP